MQQRRTFLSGLGGAAVAAAGLAVGAGALAQRPANPIARPPGRPGGPLGRGRFDSGGVASGAIPGLFVVVEVDSRAETLRLRDDSGKTAVVRVSKDLFDLDTLKPGDEVEVDFLVPGPGSNQLEAGGIWKVQR